MDEQIDGEIDHWTDGWSSGMKVGMTVVSVNRWMDIIDIWTESDQLHEQLPRVDTWLLHKIQ